MWWNLFVYNLTGLPFRNGYSAYVLALCPILCVLVLINMFRFDYTVNGGAGDPFYSGQVTLIFCLTLLSLKAAIQSFLMVIALATVPWMLLVRPLILRKQHLHGATV